HWRSGLPVSQVGVRANASSSAEHGGEGGADDQRAGPTLRALKTCGLRWSRAERRDAWRSRKVSRGVTAVLATWQHDRRLLIRGRKLRSPEVWGLAEVRGLVEVWCLIDWLLVLTHGYDSGSEPCEDPVRHG